MIASESGRSRKIVFYDVYSYEPLELFHHVQILTYKILFYFRNIKEEIK